MLNTEPQKPEMIYSIQPKTNIYLTFGQLIKSIFTPLSFCTMTNTAQLTTENERILSIDFFRGMTMFLLIGEFSELFNCLRDPYFDGTIVSWMATQLQHHPWNGLHFWDLIQPFFMFIVGVSMPFFFHQTLEQGRQLEGNFSSHFKKIWNASVSWLGNLLYRLGKN